jgi:hypothetical protein
LFEDGEIHPFALVTVNV